MASESTDDVPSMGKLHHSQSNTATHKAPQSQKQKQKRRRDLSRKRKSEAAIHNNGSALYARQTRADTSKQVCSV